MAAHITLLYAHPYPEHSRAGRRLLEAAQSVPGVHTRSLYALYPDFHIDPAAEQAALTPTTTLVLQHPLLWYQTPALLTLWFEKVLRHGWAYGHHPDGRAAQALAGKRLLWVCTTGGDADAYAEKPPSHGQDHASLEALAAPLRQLARFCGMQWLPPLAVHNALRASDETLEQHARAYRARLMAEADHAAPASAAGGEHVRYA